MGVNGIYGLSGSGMDIESMVKVGMMSKQNEYDKMAQKFTKNEWMKADYLELNSKITTFNASTLSQYKMSTTMNAKSAESSSSAVKVSAGSAAAVMSHRVEVESLSSNAYLIGVDSVTRKNSSASSSLQLSDAIFKGIAADGDNFTVKYGGTGGTAFSATFAKTDVALKFMVTDSSYSSLTGDEKTAYEKAHTISYTYEELYGTDGTDGATFNNLVSKINSLDTNIKATYDSVNDKFSFYNTKGGADNNITFTLDAVAGYSASSNVIYYSSYGNQTGTTDGVKNMALNAEQKAAVATLNTRDFINNLNLMESRSGVLYSSRDSSSDWTYDSATKVYTSPNGIIYNPAENKYYDASGNVMSSKPSGMGAAPSGFVLEVSTSAYSRKASGTDGSIKIDGVSYTTTDNTKTVNGITYTAVDTTSSAAIVSVTQDTDAIIDKVKSFVNDYNTLLADLYKKYDEKPNTDYKPLTQSQKDAMKDEQIEKWEEKAKAGLLYHDQTLGKIIQNMRNAIAEGVELEDGSTVSVFSLGISTTGLKGQLVLDEDKLKKALANDSDIVYNVFSSLGDDLDNAKTSGVAQRLGDIFVDASKKIKTRAGSSSDITEDSDLNNLLRNLQTRMSNFKKMMSSFEDALYKKYDAMESTLAKLGTQLNYIMGGSA